MALETGKSPRLALAPGRAAVGTLEIRTSRRVVARRGPAETRERLVRRAWGLSVR